MDRQLEFPESVKQYLSQDTIRFASENVNRFQNHIEAWLSPFEPRIMLLQSLLVWEKPVHSLTASIISFIFFWFLWSDHIIGVSCFLVLTLYWCYLWKEQIWPTIRVPPPSNELEEWVPVHADLLTVSDISYYAAKFYVLSKAFIEALCNLRIQKRSVFIVVIYLEGSLLLVIGHYFSGFTIFSLILFSALLLPGIIYHKVLAAVYTKMQPYLATIHNWLSTKLSSNSPLVSRLSRQRQPESDGEVRPAQHDVPNSHLHAEGDIAVGDSFPPVYDDDQRSFEDGQRFPMDDLEPEVSVMPDFEGVCDESQATFMLETDVMPSVDDVDRSRFDPSFIPRHDDNTDSETESLPFDDKMLDTHVPFDETLHSPPVPSATPAVSRQPAQVSQPSVGNQPQVEPSAPETPAGSAFDALVGAASWLGAGVFRGQQTRDDIRQDPRDRIADASVEGDMEGSLAFQESDEFDYEIISKDEVC